MAVELTSAAARAVARPLSRRRRIRRARRRPGLLRGLRLGRARRCSCCRRGRSSTRASGRRRSRTWRGTTASSRSTAAATAAPTGRRSPAAYDEREFAADALAVLDATGDRPRRHRRLLARRAARADPRHRASRARRRRGLHRPGLPGRRQAAPTSAPGSRGRTSSTPTRAGRSTTSTSGCATTAASSSFFFSRTLPRAALDEADRGLRRLGARDDSGDARRRAVLARSSSPRRRESSRGGCAARCSSCTGRAIRSRRYSRGRGARRARAAATLVLVEGGGHAPHARDPVAFNRPRPRVRSERLP